MSEGRIEVCKETQAEIFDVLEEIDQHGLAGIDVNYEKLSRNRQVEADNIHKEVNIVNEYKVAFDEGLVVLYDGETERAIIHAKNM